MHSHSHNHSVDNQSLVKCSTYITVGGVCLIIIAKLFGWFITESATLLASLIDSLLDVCISVMNLIAVHYAMRPADHEHRFGHGKAEDIAVFSQAIFFGLSGIFVIYVAVQRFFVPNESILSGGLVGIWVLVFSIVITLLIVLFQRYVVSKSKSNIIEADSLHYFVDFLTNIVAVIAIMMASYWKSVIFDNVAAIVIAIYIIYNSMVLLKKAFKNLMDHELDDQQKQIIIDVIKSHSSILGFHDLKTRYAGTKPFIQFHLELDMNMTLKEAHKISTAIEKDILMHFSNAEIIIHQDPEGVEETVYYKD